MVMFQKRMYASDEGYGRYKGTDAYWSDSGNAFYDWAATELHLLDPYVNTQQSRSSRNFLFSRLC